MLHPDVRANLPSRKNKKPSPASEFFKDLGYMLASTDKKTALKIFFAFVAVGAITFFGIKFETWRQGNWDEAIRKMTLEMELEELRMRRSEWEMQRHMMINGMDFGN